MPLPSFLQRVRSGATAPAPQAQPMSDADIEQARVKARRRMIGMAVLVGVGVIGFPWLFETQPRPLPDFNLGQSDGTRLIPGELKVRFNLRFSTETRESEPVQFKGFTLLPRSVRVIPIAELGARDEPGKGLPGKAAPCHSQLLP